eukprot:2593959-Prymnesium_polylepis.1
MCGLLRCGDYRSSNRQIATLEARMVALARCSSTPSRAQCCWNRGRVAFINTEDDESWQDQQAMFEQALQLPASTAWTTFNAFDGELPSRAGLQQQYDSVLIC